MLWDLASLGAGQVLSVLFGFAAFAYLARTLPPETYGIVEYAVGLASLAAIIIEGGMGSLGTLQVARTPSAAAELARAVPAARLLLALVIIPLVGLSTIASGFDRATSMLVWLFGLSLLAVPFKQDWLLQGLDRMTSVAPAQVLKSCAFALGVLLVVGGPGDLVRIGFVEAVAALLASGYLLIVQQRAGVPIALGAPMSRAWDLIRSGASIGASNMLWPFMVYAPILLVTNLSGTAEAAWLGAAQRIVVALVSFSGLYFVNLYPLMGRGLREDRDLWHRLVSSSFRLVAWSSIGFAAVTSVLAGSIVRLAFGDAFAAAGPVLAIYIWVLPLRLLSGHARWSLLAAERQQALLLVELACAASIVVLSAVLIPAYEAVGAALATVIGNVIGWTLAHRHAERHVGSLPGLRQLGIPTGAAVLGFVLAWFSGAGPALTLAILAVTYAVCLQLLAPDLFADAVRLAYAKKWFKSSDES